MSSRKTFRACLFVLAALLLLACSVSGLAAPALDAEETPTGAIPGGGGGSDRSGAGGNSGGAGGGNADSIVESIPYSIYVRAVVNGKCGAHTNSAGFKNMELEASFTGIVFVRPMGKGLPGPFGGVHRATGPAAFAVSAGIYLDGRGDIQRMEYCPQYETEVDTYAVKIVSGPNPFQAWIGVMSPTATDAGADVVPTKTPVGGGEAWVMFHIGNGESGGPILVYEIDGHRGEEDEMTLGNPVRFITTWDQLMKGEDFTIKMTGGDEGETWNWEMRFVPEPITAE